MNLNEFSKMEKCPSLFTSKRRGFMERKLLVSALRQVGI